MTNPTIPFWNRSLGPPFFFSVCGYRSIGCDESGKDGDTFHISIRTSADAGLIQVWCMSGLGEALSTWETAVTRQLNEFPRCWGLHLFFHLIWHPDVFFGGSGFRLRGLETRGLAPRIYWPARCQLRWVLLNLFAWFVKWDDKLLSCKNHGKTLCKRYNQFK